MATAVADRPVGDLLREWRQRRSWPRDTPRPSGNGRSGIRRWREPARPTTTGTRPEGAVNDRPAGVVVPLRLATPTGPLSFITTTTVFGTPVDITLSELALETFFPADEATAAALRKLG